MEIRVTRQCWGCGSEQDEYEETDEPIPSQTIWNLCPECINRKEVKQNEKEKDFGRNLDGSGVDGIAYNARPSCCRH